MSEQAPVIFTSFLFNKPGVCLKNYVTRTVKTEYNTYSVSRK